MTWPRIEFIDETRPTAAENLAVDEALLIAAEDRDGPAVLRIWELPAQAVVLGASGRVGDDVRLENCRADGVEIARRSSGGGTVVIGPGAINFTVVLPIGADPRLRTVEGAQAFILGRTAEAIRRGGLPVEVLGSGDLTLGRRKFSGSAQRRLRDHVLVHASLLFDFPLGRVERYTHLPSRRPEYREGRSHGDFLTNLPVGRPGLVDALRSAWAPHDPAPAAIAEDLVEALVERKFANDGWIYRL